MARVLIGTCSWTDPTLIESGRFYPPECKTAEARLRYYAHYFPLVEVDSSYYGLPSERNAALWVERTPDGFVFDVKAFSLFTHHPTPPGALPRDIRERLPQAAQTKRLYLRDVPPDSVAELWQRFRSALLPLRSAGKLGSILLQFPRWFGLSRERKAYLESARAELEGWPVAVEFRGGGWLDEGNRDETFDLLRRAGCAFVCVDEPQGFRSSAPAVAEVTADLALVRFHGRNTAAWERPGQTAAQRFDYWYGEEELAEWVPRIQGLAQQAREVHLLMNTNYQDQGVVNARRLVTLLGGQTALELP